MSSASLDLAQKVALLKVLLHSLTGDQFKNAFAVLLHFHNSDTGKLYPSYSQLAEVANTSRPTSVATMKRLKDIGLIDTPEERNTGGRNKRNNYTVNGQVADRLLAETVTQPTASGKEFFTKRSASRPAIINEIINEPINDAEFDTFWATYPRRVGKKGAKQLFDKIIKRGEATADQLIQGAINYQLECDGREERFIKHPTTWLRNACWTDPPPKPRVRQAGERWIVVYGTPEFEAWRQSYQRQNSSRIWEFDDKPGCEVDVPSRWPRDGR